MAKPKPFPVGRVSIGGKRPAFILGPCVIESEKFVRRMAKKITDTCAAEEVDFIFKASYDKANRTSVRSFRGIGVREGCDILADIGRELKIPVTTDVHSPAEAEIAGEKIDMLQIPAFLCRQTDLLRVAAETSRAINVKKGQFLAPWDMRHAAAKIASTGNERILLCERGTSFGYNTLVVDMRALPIMAQTGYPVVFDATHSVAQPGGLGDRSGGQREFAPVLARAAAAVGVAAIFIETHRDPDHTTSAEGPTMMPLKALASLLESLVAFDRLAKARPLIA